MCCNSPQKRCLLSLSLIPWRLTCYSQAWCAIEHLVSDSNQHHNRVSKNTPFFSFIQKGIKTTKCNHFTKKTTQCRFSGVILCDNWTAYLTINYVKSVGRLWIRCMVQCMALIQAECLSVMTTLLYNKSSSNCLSDKYKRLLCIRCSQHMSDVIFIPNKCYKERLAFQSPLSPFSWGETWHPCMGLFLATTVSEVFHSIKKEKHVVATQLLAGANHFWAK